jgi:hypothetical protein
MRTRHMLRFWSEDQFGLLRSLFLEQVWLCSLSVAHSRCIVTESTVLTYDIHDKQLGVEHLPILVCYSRLPSP